MHLISKYNKRVRLLLYVFDIYCKYTWFVPLKNKRSITITNTFQKVLGYSGRKPNKVWVDQGSDFYKRSLKSWLNNNGPEMYSTHNERKAVIADNFFRTLKHNVYKHMTAASRNVSLKSWMK